MNGASGSIVARPTESDPDPDSFSIATDGYIYYEYRNIKAH
jgi:hypothetical protein